VLVVVDDAVVVVPVTGFVELLVVVVLSCAQTVLSATAPAAPAANIFTNLVCFMFVLCFG
jgi:hypothetical protein